MGSEREAMWISLAVEDEVAQLRAALKDAIEGMDDMVSYVPDYFREKWEHDAYIERAKRALGEPSDG